MQVELVILSWNHSTFLAVYAANEKIDFVIETFFCHR